MNFLVSNAIKARHLPNIRKYKNQLVEELKSLNNKFPVQPYCQSLKNDKMDCFIPQQEDIKDYIALR